MLKCFITDSTPTAPTCQNLTNPICSTLNYTSVSLPNHFGQTSQAEAAYLINMLTTLESKDVCREIMLSVGCALTYPNCTESGAPLPPCRAACRGKWLLDVSHLAEIIANYVILLVGWELDDNGLICKICSPWHSLMSFINNSLWIQQHEISY